MLIGYCRSSTAEQIAGLEAQQKALIAHGCEKLFSEHVSSVDAKRPELQRMLDFAREGDTVLATRIDRLSRSVAELLRIVELLDRKGVGLRILDFGGGTVDLNSPTGRLTVTMLAAIAEFERTLMLERQKVGIAKAKAQGKYRGRAPTARRQASKVLGLHAEGMGVTKIAAEVGISTASVYRIIRRPEATVPACREIAP